MSLPTLDLDILTNFSKLTFYSFDINSLVPSGELYVLISVIIYCVYYLRLKDKARKMKKHVKPAVGSAVGGTAAAPRMNLVLTRMILVSTFLVGSIWETNLIGSGLASAPE